MRALDGSIGCFAIVLDPAPVETLIGTNLVMHIVGPGQRVFHVHNGGQFLDIGLDGLNRVARLFCRFCDHGGIGITHMANLTMSQHGALWFMHGGAIA